VSSEGTTTRLQPNGVLPATQALPHQDEVFLHLAAGGVDGSNIGSRGGMIVVGVPEGPLPN
jgi:hypothetical protein